MSPPSHLPLTYAMDTAFFSPHTFYPLELRCEMTAEAGYDATHMTLWWQPERRERNWDEMLRLREVPASFGLGGAAIHASTSACPPDWAVARHYLDELLELLPPGCDLELQVGLAAGVTRSDPRGDSTFLRFLEPLLDRASQLERRIVLYPHLGAWIERFDDAVRLCQTAAHPALRAIFCGYHWFLCGGSGHGLAERIRAAMPYITAANLSGSRKILQDEATLEPLDSGTLDNFHLYALLRSANSMTRIGVQHYAVGGDILENLHRSRAALSRWEATLERHPDWCESIVMDGA